MLWNQQWTWQLQVSPCQGVTAIKKGVNKQRVTYPASTPCIDIFSAKFNIFIISQKHSLLTQSRKIIQGTAEFCLIVGTHLVHLY